MRLGTPTASQKLNVVLMVSSEETGIKEESHFYRSKNIGNEFYYSDFSFEIILSLVHVKLRQRPTSIHAS